MVEDKSACIVASDCVDIVCSALRLLVESAARLRLSLGAAARRGRRLCGFWGAVVVAVAVSSVSNETYYGTVDPYNRFYGRILRVVTYGPLTIGRFTGSNSITDSKFPIQASWRS